MMDIDSTTPDEDCDIIVASVAKLGRSSSIALERYEPDEFKCIIIGTLSTDVDEAHHAPAPSYQRILEYFRIYESNSKLKLWGCSATLYRHDQIALSPTFEKIAYERPLIEMIKENW